jgi:hypothetical protein
MMQGMQKRLAERRLWWVALAAGLLLRAVFVWKHPRFDGDTLVYGDLARNLLQHRVYGLTENVVRPTLIRLPGYPLFLALCFAVFGVGRYLPVLWVQVAVGLASCWMLGRLAERMFDARVGLWVLWLAALCPFTAIFDGGLALTESWSLFCVVAAFFALERWFATGLWRWVVAVGAACAWAVLLRPEQGLLAAAVVPAMLLRGRARLQAAGLAAVIVALPLAVWAARNWRVFHVVQPLAPKYANDPGEFVSYGFNRWYRTWGVEYLSTVNTYWLWDGAAISMKDLPARAIDDAAQRAETERAYAAYNAQSATSPKVDAMFARLASERVRTHPVRTYVVMPVGRLLDMWLRPRTEFFKLPLDWWRFGAYSWWKTALCVVWGLLDWVLLLAAVMGLRRWRWDALGVAMMGFVVLRCVLLLTIDNSEPRYTLECFPVVFVLAAVVFAQRRKQDGEESTGHVHDS